MEGSMRERIQPCRMLVNRFLKKNRFFFCFMLYLWSIMYRFALPNPNGIRSICITHLFDRTRYQCTGFFFMVIGNYPQPIIFAPWQRKLGVPNDRCNYGIFLSLNPILK